MLRVRWLARLIAITALALPTPTWASPLPPLPGLGGGPVSFADPGPAFDWPAPVAGYFWRVDIGGVTTVPSPVVDFTVTNTTRAPLTIDTFQVFGNCTPTNTPAWRPGFDIAVNGTLTDWTRVIPDLCFYHNVIDYVLPPGPTRFTVFLNDMPDTTARYVDVRFGNVMPAIPLPPAAALILGAIAALVLVARSRRAA